eukprot:5186799-Prymnesium_polylepis.1
MQSFPGPVAWRCGQPGNHTDRAQRGEGDCRLQADGAGQRGRNWKCPCAILYSEPHHASTGCDAKLGRRKRALTFTNACCCRRTTASHGDRVAAVTEAEIKQDDQPLLRHTRFARCIAKLKGDSKFVAVGIQHTGSRLCLGNGRIRTSSAITKGKQHR